jgi:hypothetical protein
MLSPFFCLVVIDLISILGRAQPRIFTEVTRIKLNAI